MKSMVLVLVVAVLAVGTAFALESGPSNPVGFFTVNVTHSAGVVGYCLVSFPTLPADASLGNTLGAQLPSGTSSLNATQILWYDNINSGYKMAWRRTSDGAWVSTTTPTLTTLESRKGYYILLRGGAPTSIDVVIAGDVRVGPTWDMNWVNTGYNMTGSVYAASVHFDSSRIVSGTDRFRGGGNSLSSDQIIRFSGTAFQIAWLSTTSGWSGTPADFRYFDPGRGYFVYRRTGGTPPRVNFQWNDYPVPAGGTSATDNVIATTPQPPIINAPATETAAPATLEKAPAAETAAPAALEKVPAAKKK